MTYRQYPNIAVADMNGGHATRRALIDLRTVDARRLRNWRIITGLLALAWIAFGVWYWVR